jgi:hypothetical protein
MTRTIVRFAGFLAVAVAAALGGLPPAGAADRYVNTCSDNGAELRAQVAAASPFDFILLSAGCHITLRAGGTIVIDKPMAVLGSYSDETSIDGGHVERVFRVNATNVQISSLTIRNGRAAGDGGGVLVEGGVAALLSVHVADNFATRWGGGIAVASGASLVLRNSTISGNASGGTDSNGGGIDNAGTLTVVNSTISGNSSLAVTGPGGGGGILNIGMSATATIGNSTIANNFSAGGSPGHGIRSAGGTATLQNTLLADNGAPNCAGTIASGGHNLEDADTCGFDPALGDVVNALAPIEPLRVNRPTLFMAGPRTELPTHALSPSSAAIDAGDNATCEGNDQRGAQRPLGVNGLPPVCDIGAVEMEPLLVSTGTGPTGGPHVKLFAVTSAGAPLQPGGGFLAYDPGFIGGVQAAFANTRSGLVLVTGVGSGGGPHIKLFRVINLETGAVRQVGPGFMAYDPGFTGGARVAATADEAGNLIIVTGVGSGGGAHVKVFRVSNLGTGDAVQLGDGFFAYDPGFLGGVNIGAR